MQSNPNVCNQRHLKISAEITSKNKTKQKKRKKKNKENNHKAFDYSLSAYWQIYSQTYLRVFHTCSKLGFINFHHTDFKNGKLTARKGTGDFKFKLS